MRAGGLIFRSVVVVVVVASVLACLSVSASAELAHNEISSFGPAGPGSGLFSNVQGVTVDQSTGYVYVYDIAGSGSVYKFDSSGKPVVFLAHANVSEDTNVLEGVGLGGFFAVDELAVSPAGATKGDLYVANGSTVGVYNSETGVKLGELNSGVQEPLIKGPWGSACGVAVDPAGRVYVGLESHQVNRYTSAAGVVENKDYDGSLWNVGYESCNLAADSAGSVFVVDWALGPVTNYPESEFNKTEVSPVTGTVVDGSGSTLAVAPGTDELYVDEQGQVSQFGPHGEPVEKPVATFAGSGTGAISGSYGIGIYDTQHEIYVSNNASKNVEIFNTVTVPNASTGSASKITSRTATLEGEVNAEATTVTACRFEYGTTIEGTTPAYGLSIPCSSTPQGSAPVPLSVEVSALEPNATYHYRLVASDSEGTSYGEDKTLSTPPTVPVARVLRATSESPTVALLYGTVNPENSGETSYRFVYGTTASYGSSVPPGGEAQLGSFYADRQIVQTVEGLQPDTTYHYALVATNSQGTGTSQDATFTTGPLKLAMIQTESAGTITQTSVIIAGTIDPQGVQSYYEIDLGVDTTYGTRVFGNAGFATGTVTVTETFQNLAANTTYHYRIIASNMFGTIYGTGQTFTTPTYPTAILTPPTPLALVAIPTVTFPPETQTSTPRAKQTTKKKPKKKHGRTAKDKKATRSRQHHAPNRKVK